MAAVLTQRPFAIQTWGQALRMARARITPPLSARDLADRCGVGKKVIEAWEDGEEHPTSQQLKRLHASVPTMVARQELWRNETQFAKPADRGPHPMPETKRAPPAPPPPAAVTVRAGAVALPPPPPAPAREEFPMFRSPPPALPAGASAVAAAGVMYAVALSEVKAAKDAERRAAADHAAAVKAAADKMTEAQVTLRDKLAAVDAAKKALDEAVENEGN